LIQKSIAETLAKLKTCKIVLEQETESYNFEFNNGTFTKIKNNPVPNYFANLVRQDIALNNFKLVPGHVENNYINKNYYYPYDYCDEETKTAFVDMNRMIGCTPSSDADSYFDRSSGTSSRPQSVNSSTDVQSRSSSDVPESLRNVEAINVLDEDLGDAFQGNLSKEEKWKKEFDEDIEEIISNRRYDL
jgi:hypothetical protein